MTETEITAETAAHILGLSVSSLERYIRSGELRWKRKRARATLDRAEVEALATRRAEQQAHAAPTR